MGGTNLKAGLVNRESISKITSTAVNNQASRELVLDQLFSITDQLMNVHIKGIGIGVPGLVDEKEGIVYDVINIPSWKEIALQKIMEERYKLPVFINNDANCFVLGEYYFGKGKGFNSMIGLTIGTGLGAGIIINKKLYTGANCGAGEFGMVQYLDKFYEYYASGQFFKNIYNMDGETVFKNAKQSHENALHMYSEFGNHLGNAINMIMYTYDPPLIILGGSVRYAWPYFQERMWQQIRTFAYSRSVEHLQIMSSDLENSGILGAAALHF